MSCTLSHHITPIKPCREFFLTEQQEHYTDNQHNYTVHKKMAIKSDGKPYCPGAIVIELYKNNQQLAHLLSTPLAWNFARACGKTVQLQATTSTIIEVIDRTTKKINSVLSIANNFVDTASVNSIDLVLSDNEHYAASIARNNVALYWDIQNKQPIITIGDKKNLIIAVALSPDGSLFAAANNEGIIYIVDATTKKVVQKKLRSNYYTEIYGLAFSNDGKQLIAVAMPHEKYYKVKFFHRADGTIKENLPYLDLEPQDVLVPHCYHHMTVFNIN